MTRDEMVAKMAELGNQDLSAEFLAEYDALDARNKALEAEKEKLSAERASLRDTNQKLFLRISQPAAEKEDKFAKSDDEGGEMTLSERIQRAKGQV